MFSICGRYRIKCDKISAKIKYFLFLYFIFCNIRYLIHGYFHILISLIMYKLILILFHFLNYNTIIFNLIINITNSYFKLCAKLVGILSINIK